ncbi:hypothetical protein AYI70_g5453 [Smittium culicis]|uniref:Uncharacterized protein n=1 Tax=Smittium culicis TaxID=133412 RepID=A0A1R1XGK5_9FUNG|nr:hypothetical protein AYI70_g12293 [Smittium culicis]OMJ13736.1 hypothetical protein AYI70_g8332 [Smittium culicis]OMJ18263.1 hypothetical protein AYI70_g5453 [Smittium culicis]
MEIKQEKEEYLESDSGDFEDAVPDIKVEENNELVGIPSSTFNVSEYEDLTDEQDEFMDVDEVGLIKESSNGEHPETSEKIDDDSATFESVQISEATAKGDESADNKEKATEGNVENETEEGTASKEEKSNSDEGLENKIAIGKGEIAKELIAEKDKVTGNTIVADDGIEKKGNEEGASGSKRKPSPLEEEINHKEKTLAEFLVDMDQYSPIERKTVLTQEDLSNALSEYGINIKKPDFFH